MRHLESLYEEEEAPLPASPRWNFQLLQKFMVSPAKDANKKNCMQTNKRIRFMVSVKRKRG